MATTVPPSLYKDVRLHKIFERILPEGGRRKVVGHTRLREDPQDDGVLTVYQLRDAKGEVRSREAYVEIVSPTLQDFLRKVLEGYPESSLDASPMRFRHPYYSLVHRHVQIEKSAVAFTGSAEEKKHISHLLRFVCDELRDEIKEYDALKGLSSDVSFTQLWSCFIPGQVVVKKDGVHYEECYKITDIQYTPALSDNLETQFFLVSARQCQYASGLLGESRGTQWPLQYYPGTKDIRTLDWIPLEAHHNSVAFKQKKIQDGHKWLRILSRAPYHHACYDAVAFTNDKILFPPVQSRYFQHWRIEDYNEEFKEFKPLHV